MLDGVSGIADFECRQLLRERYLRIAPVFPSGAVVPMDGIDMIPYMTSFAESVVNWLSPGTFFVGLVC